MFTRSARPTTPARTVLRLESLESREVPAILIQLDYSRDTSGFFNNAEARATLEHVATELGNSLNANLAAITPSGGNTWTATFFDPATGAQTSLSNLSIGANTLRVFVGARSLSSSEAGFGGFGGYSISGSQGWLNTVQTRGHSGFAPWGGSVTFDSRQNWHFGQTTAGLDSNELDFYSVAAHELGHVLGIGTSNQWRNLVQGGTFRGSNAMSVYGGAVPVTAGGDHWASGITANGQAVSLDPSISFGQRVSFSSLDAAALSDLGWSAVSAPPASSAPPGVTLVPVAGTNGMVIQYAIVNGVVIPTGQQFNPFPGYRGAFNQTHADFDGDGVLDVAVSTVGPGVGAVAILSGLDGHYIGGPRLALGGVVVMVAADIDGNGTTELITAEGTPLGIYVYNVTGGQITADARFAAFGSPGRAALTASGELDRTGYGDTISEYVAEEKARLDNGPSGPAAYTVSADPVKHMCACAGCQALAQLAGTDDESNGSAWEDDLMPTIAVA